MATLLVLSVGVASLLPPPSAYANGRGQRAATARPTKTTMKRPSNGAIESALAERRRTTTLRLPAERWDQATHRFRGAVRHPLGTRISFRRRGKTLIKRTEADGPVVDGQFERTVTETRIPAPTPAAAAAAGREATAATPPPPWSKDEARFLFTTKKLGAAVNPRGEMELTLWWPEADKVELRLLDSDQALTMVPEEDGVWRVAVPGKASALYGKRYEFVVDGAKRMADPYGRSQDGDLGPSRFVDEAFAWGDQAFVPPTRTTDWIVAEVHVGDETSHASSPVPAPLRGTYLGMAHPSVIAHYKELGVNAIELMPVMESRQGAHWGYMTSAFFAPSDRFATAPGRATQELKTLVDAYHKAGIAVVMDVVYNHTANGLPHFDLFGGNYFYRNDAAGRRHNAAGVGNEFATENPMAQKLVLDSKRYWMEEFHIDGTRDDLANVVDRDTTRKATRLKIDGQPTSPAGAKHPQKQTRKFRFLTGEPWAWDKSREQWQAGDFDGTTPRVISSWDARFRETAREFLQGKAQADALKTVIAGNVRPFGPGQTPASMTKYIESHDESTVGDIVGPSGVARANLAMGLLAVAQGPIMLGHAQEWMRSKNGPPNLYDDPIRGQKRWATTPAQAQAFAFAKAILAYRKGNPHFHYQRALTSDDIRWLSPTSGDGEGSGAFVGFAIKAPADAPPPKGRAAWGEIIVLMNAHATATASYDLPAGQWKVVTDGTRFDAQRGIYAHALGSYRVNPGSIVILEQVP